MRTIIVSLCIFFSLSVQATTSDYLTDTSRVNDKVALLQLSEDYDSLLHSWYVSRSLNQNNDDTVAMEDIANRSMSMPHDSVIRKNMTEMPVFFDMTYNRIVKSYFKVYLKDKRELTETVLGLSEYYFPYFESILDAHNLPLELKYLPVIESALNPRAVSRVGATGLWQFMYATGRFLDMEITSFVDERRDPVASTYAAADYLNSLHEIFGDWTLALAAYNCGPGNVNKAIRRSGGKTNFWDLYYYLPRETRGYVPGFIAVLYIFHHQEDLNLNAKDIEMPLLTDTVKLTQKLHLKQVAEVMQLPLGQLQDLNPQYRRNIIPGGKEYALRLPYKRATDFIALQDSILNYKDSVYFNTKALASKPSKQRYYGEAPSGNYTRLYYRVKPGDNLGFIADWYDVRIRDLRYWNGIRGSMIRTGQRLNVYIPKSRAANYKNIDKLSFAEKQKREGNPVSNTQSKKVSKKYPDDGKYEYYTLKKGETLWEVAKRYEGVSDRDILRMNNLTTGRYLKAGQRIKVKRIN
ncbi:lytic transglycosylase domain-containing protein [Salinivirga cyanobacteriivorans]